jgi:predicted DsbA family dithiol-disulfide isomerase
MEKALTIEVASDVICPWCYIGKRRLEKALETLKGEVEVRIEWLPFQLNPDMPPGGIARADYRRAKFGSIEKGRALDARVAQEGAGKWVVAKVNTEDAQNLARRFRINAIPTMALFKDGLEVTRQVGAMAAPAIRKFLEPYVKNGKS